MLENARRLIAIIPLLLMILFFLPNSVEANCGIQPSTQTNSCIALNIQNAQSSAFSVNTQVMITFNALSYSSYLAGNLMNVYAYNSLSGATGPLWIEGNVFNEQSASLNTGSDIIMWLRLPDAVAASSNDINWYIGIGSTTTDFLGNAIAQTGEAPQLTSPYGSADNGNTVFLWEDNFIGSTLKSTWTCPSGATCSVNNGLTYTNPVAGWTTGGLWNSQSITVGTTAIDALSNIQQNSCMIIGASQADLSGAGTYGIDIHGNGVGVPTLNHPAATDSQGFGSQLVTGVYYISSVEPTSASALSVAYNYTTSTSATGLSITATNPVIGSNPNCGSLSSITENAFWIRTRTTPPNNVQPTITLGIITSAIPVLSISPNPSVYEQSVTLTASCSPGDSCAIDYPSLGTHLAIGASTASYIYLSGNLATGTYSYYANDITRAFNSIAQTLTVNKGALAYSLNNCTNEAWTIGAGYSCATTGTFAYSTNQIAANAQVTGTLTLNSATVGTTTSTSATASNTISNTIFQACYAFTTPSTANFLAGNANPVCWYGYVPFTAYNGVTTINNIPTNGIISSNTISGTPIPWELYTKSPSNSISFWLSNTLNNGAISFLQSNVLNISYVASNQIIAAGNWLFTANEIQPNNPLSINITLTENMIALNPQVLICQPRLSYATENIQYFPIAVDGLPGGCWNNLPSNIFIDGYKNSTSNPAANIVITKGSNTISLPFNMNAIFSLFSPSLTFNLSGVNIETPNTMPSSFSLCPFQFISSNTQPTGGPPGCNNLYIRRIINISSYNQSNQAPIASNTQLFISGNFNNFTISSTIFANTTVVNALAFNGTYIANSLFQNPVYKSTIINTSSTASVYENLINNFFPSSINGGTWRSFNIYLVPDSKAAYTNFQINGCNGQTPTGSILEIFTGLSGSTQQLVQTYKMTAVPFSLWMQAGTLYALDILNGNAQQIQSFPASSYGTSITLSTSCLPTPVNTASPLIGAVCSTNYATNTVTCSGSDTQDYVTAWQINITYHPNELETKSLAANTISGSSFQWTYQLPNQSTEFTIGISSLVGRSIDPLYPVLNYLVFPQTSIVTPFQQNGFFFGILLFLIFLAVAWVDETAAVLGFGAILVLGNTLGVFSFPPNFIYGMFSLMLFIAMLMWIFRE